MSDISEEQGAKGGQEAVITSLEHKPRLDLPEENWSSDGEMAQYVTPPGIPEFKMLLNTQESAHYPSPVSTQLMDTETSETEPRHKDDPKQGVCGLHNLGNTCFMNAGLQCLMSNTHLVQHFLSTLGPGELSTTNATLTGRLAQLVFTVWSGQQTVLKPREFKDTLAMYHSQFQDYRQHDCQEFLALLLDTLHEQLAHKKELLKPIPLLQKKKLCQDEFVEGQDKTIQVTPGGSRDTTGPSIFHPCAQHLAQDVDHDQSSSGEPQGHHLQLRENSEDTGLEEEEPREVLLEDSSSRLPSLEDLYMKDTKTLNTNVLAEELEEVATDSEKFHKQDNTGIVRETLPSIHQLVLDTKSKNKHVKDTNLLANLKEKFVNDDYSKKYLYCDEEMDGGFNNSKRMRMDSEKNVRMQAKLKMNTGKNPLLSSLDEETTGASCMNNTRSVLKPIRNLDSIFQSAGPSNVNGSCASAGDSNNVIENSLILEAEKVWSQYLQENQSVVVSTFQGQFKSTVICSECSHVSVTFEPFMYLSVPLPNAMERQISVVYVPRNHTPPPQVLLTLTKQDKVEHLKRALVEMLGIQGSEVIVAEVLNNHVSRVLDDNVMLRYVNDYSRSIYAFEMCAPPSIDSCDATSSDQLHDIGCQTDAISSDLQNNLQPSPESSAVAPLQANSSCTKLNNQLTTGALNNAPVTKGLNEEVQMETAEEDDPLSLSLPGAFPSDNPAVFSMTMESGSSQEGDSCNVPSATGENSGGKKEGAEDDISPALLAAVEGTFPGAGDGVGKFGDQWKSCAICLEEMADRELMVHTTCGGTLCHACLEMSFKHYGDAAFTCPVCNACPVKVNEDFVQMDAMASYKPKTRLLTVPLTYRLDPGLGAVGEGKLVGHPNLVYVPSNLTGAQLHGRVMPLVPPSDKFILRLTDGEGVRCSRCLYTKHCHGCAVPNDDTELTLQPGDHLTVSFTGGPDLALRLNQTIEHPSMGSIRSSEPLTLTDCIEAFSQSEKLDSANPWYCPECQRNQCANKTMTVWRYPNTLVVHLKRFVFHELSSTKLDNQVIFPLEGLDVSDLVSGPYQEGLLYDLQSCVCHFGGVEAGHYTAFTKHPVTHEWWHYNDEEAEQRPPGEEEYSTGYILFYQRQGTETELSLPEKLCVKEAAASSSYMPISSDCIAQLLENLPEVQTEPVYQKPELDFYE